MKRYDNVDYFQTACPDRYGILKEFAKENRNNQTIAEKCLWQNLKGKALGVKFLRQHILCDFIVDFISLEKNLVIEVDGGYHAELSQMERDADRTERISRLGYKVLRFSNEDVLHKTDLVINKIKEFI